MRGLPKEGYKTIFGIGTRLDSHWQQVNFKKGNFGLERSEIGAFMRGGRYEEICGGIFREGSYPGEKEKWPAHKGLSEKKGINI